MGGRGEGRGGGERRDKERREGRGERGEGREGRWMKGKIYENLNSVQEGNGGRGGVII